MNKSRRSFLSKLAVGSVALVTGVMAKAASVTEYVIGPPRWAIVNPNWVGVVEQGTPLAIRQQAQLILNSYPIATGEIATSEHKKVLDFVSNGMHPRPSSDEMNALCENKLGELGYHPEPGNRWQLWDTGGPGGSSYACPHREGEVVDCQLFYGKWNYATKSSPIVDHSLIPKRCELGQIHRQVD